MSKHIANIAALLTIGSPVAIVAANQIAQVQAFIYKMPVDQVLEIAKALISG